jgi:AIPR protein
LSLDELEDGWVDDSDDGGIDGFYVFIDGTFLSDQFEIKHIRQEPHIEVYILTVKSADTFKQAPVVSLITSLEELFNFQLDTMQNPHPAQLLEVRERFKSTYVDLAPKNPRLSIHVRYCSRGDTARLGKNIGSKLTQLRNIFTSFFSRVTADALALGATELLHLAQRTKKYSLSLPFTETYISRDGANYVILCRLKDYLSFVTDENGELRRYLFDGNVRDYLGDVQVNHDIANALLEPGGVDFWWLNNGVTILASGTTGAGKALSINDVLIVNGLQTTETLYRTLTGRVRSDDERAILIKIIISGDDDARARIIKATNYQSAVDLASLRSLDQLQRNIETYLFDHGWFYERRSNFYRNQGKPGDRIISIRQLGTAVRALAFRTPRTAERRQKWLRDDNSYRQVFNPAWPLSLYLGCMVVSRSVELAAKARSGVWADAASLSGLLPAA